MRAQTFNRTKAPSGEKTPIEAVATPEGVSEQIIRHTGFTVSWNGAMRIPNWVTWELTPEEAAAEGVARTDDFRPDPAVEGVSSQDSDYRGSGYDRGHMAPAADFRWSRKAMSETFMLSNICPQARALNDGIWLELEQKCRWWAKKYKSPVYITCGPCFMLEEASCIGRNEVIVPDTFFKCVLQQRDGRWTAAVFFFLNMDCGLTLDQVCYPVSVVPAMTGFGVFQGLTQEEHDFIETHFRKEDWTVEGWKRK